MKITYFSRNSKVGFSIQKVFGIIIFEISKYATTELIEMPSKGSMPWDTIKNGIYTFLNRNKKGINHVTGHIHDIILALTGCKCVLTIHDLVFIDNVKNPFKRLYKWFFWLYLPVRFADHVVCISSETQKKLLKYIYSNKTSVILNPIDPKYEFVSKDFNEKKPVILHVGTGWNKNLRRTILALNGINCHLRIVGKIKPEIFTLLKNEKIEYSNIFNLTDDEIRKEYINCDIVNFPSEYEGFGMPIIEGQQTGRVVIASYIEPLIEVSGGAVKYINPENIESLRSAFIEIINNKTIRETLIKEGLENVKRFSVEKIAAQYFELYKKILNEK